MISFRILLLIMNDRTLMLFRINAILIFFSFPNSLGNRLVAIQLILANTFFHLSEGIINKERKENFLLLSLGTDSRDLVIVW